MRKKNVSTGETLGLSEKLSRLGSRLRDPEWRHYGMLLLAGKALGLVLLCVVIIGGPTILKSVWGLVNTVAYAQQEAPQAPAPDPYKTVTAGDIINPVNT